MAQNEELRPEDAAANLAEHVEDLVNNPEKAARRITGKLGLLGVFKTVVDFVRSYRAKEPGLSDEAWIARQFAKPEYADAWQGEEGAAEREKAAREIVQGVEDYENAKKSLRSHIDDLDGTEASWLAEQIEIGAERNGVGAAEYAKEIQSGLDEAVKENQELLFQDEPEATKEAQS